MKEVSDQKLTAQEIYDKLYIEACSRAKRDDKPLPSEEDVFRSFLRQVRVAIATGEAPLGYYNEVEEVRSFEFRAKQKNDFQALINQTLAEIALEKKAGKEKNE